MKKSFFLALIFISFSLFGQQPNKSASKIKLTGVVLDKETQQPLEYATISIKDPNKAGFLQGGITDVEGKFSVEVLSGTYDVSIEYIGFDSFSQEGLVLNEKKISGKLSSTSREKYCKK